MGKKKWIDKRNAQTFTLTRKYVDSDEDEKDQRGQQQARGGEDDYDVDPELAELLGMASIYDDASYELPEERRKAILELGLPDDGYDYLRHLRAAGPQRAGGLRPLTQGDAGQPSSSATGPSSSSVAAPPPSAAAPSVRRTAADIAAEVLAAAPDGPSVHIDAPRWTAPPPDVRLVDARALSLAEKHAKRMDELSALEAAATVSAFSRTADAKLAARGRLAAELAELEAAMRVMEEEEERERYQHGQQQQQQQQRQHASAAAAAAAAQQQQQQQQQVQDENMGGEEKEEDGDWDEWMDQFVVAATAAPSGPAQSYSATRGLRQLHHEAGADGRQGEGAPGAVHIGDEDEGEGSEWDDSYDGGVEGSEHDCVGPLGGHLQGAGRGSRAAGAPSARGGVGSNRGSVAGGAREGSIASSYWRDEREDRRETLDMIDQRFEHIALQYEDGDMGELDDEAAERARGTADISAFGNVLQEFLDEQVHLESEQGMVAAADGFEGLDASSVPELADMDNQQFEAWIRRKQANGNIAGTSASRKVEAIEDHDPAVIAAVKARIAAVASRMDAQGYAEGGPEGEAYDPLGPEGRKVFVEDRGERWDCESVLSMRSNLENHPRKIVEGAAKPQPRTGNQNGPAITLSAKTGLPVGMGRHQGSAQGRGGLAGCSIPEEGGEQGPGSCERADQGLDSSPEASSSGSGSDMEDAASVAFSIATTARQKGESAEERRTRKNAVKELRRANRASKKELKTLFKAEAGKQRRQAAGKAAAGGARGGSTFVIP